MGEENVYFSANGVAGDSGPAPVMGTAMKLQISSKQLSDHLLSCLAVFHCFPLLVRLI
jgi:hypothetical protein